MLLKNNKMDSRVRGNDGSGWGMTVVGWFRIVFCIQSQTIVHPTSVIPVKTGIHFNLFTHASTSSTASVNSNFFSGHSPSSPHERRFFLFFVFIFFHLTRHEITRNQITFFNSFAAACSLIHPRQRLLALFPAQFFPRFRGLFSGCFLRYY